VLFSIITCPKGDALDNEALFMMNRMTGNGKPARGNIEGKKKRSKDEKIERSFAAHLLHILFYCWPSVAFR
jgi:hypothetical protein